jgi:isopenicillin-N epimerase
MLELPLDERADGWALDPTVTYLNHGSFGACPTEVLEYQGELRARMERQPVQFFVRDLESLLDEARSVLAKFVGARATDLVFVSNATTAVNAVLRSVPLRHGDEILTTDHAYGACRNALTYAAARAGAQVVVAPVPFPVHDEDRILAAISAKTSGRTRLALIDHVTSQTALVFPIQRIVKDLQNRGVDVLVDGAHAPGMIPLDVGGLGAAYYAGNCHKWLCAPKGAGFLVVREDRQAGVFPSVISHGATLPTMRRSRFQLLFDWTGTDDPTACLCVPEAIRWMGSRARGGWSAVMARNHALAIEGRRILLEALGVPAPCPPDLLGSLASLPLPPADPEEEGDALTARLLAEHGVEVPISPWPSVPQRWLRISAQLYNRRSDYELLAKALVQCLRITAR